MIGGAFGICVAGQVALDMATEDMGNRRFVKKSITRAALRWSAAVSSRVSRPGIRKSPENSSAVFSS